MHFPTQQSQADSTEAGAPSPACSQLRLHQGHCSLHSQASSWGGKQAPDLSFLLLFPDCSIGRFSFNVNFLRPLLWGLKWYFSLLPWMPSEKRQLFQIKEDRSFKWLSKYQNMWDDNDQKRWEQALSSDQLRGTSQGKGQITAMKSAVHLVL